MAIEAGNLLGLPVVVSTRRHSELPNVNLRHYHFLQQGLRDVAEDATQRGIGFIVRSVLQIARNFWEVQAVLLVLGDEIPSASPSAGASLPPPQNPILKETVNAPISGGLPSRIFLTVALLCCIISGPRTSRPTSRSFSSRQEKLNYLSMEAAQKLYRLPAFAETLPLV